MACFVRSPLGDTAGGGLGDMVMCDDVRQTAGRHTGGGAQPL